MPIRSLKLISKKEGNHAVSVVDGMINCNVMELDSHMISHVID